MICYYIVFVFVNVVLVMLLFFVEIFDSCWVMLVVVCVFCIVCVFCWVLIFVFLIFLIVLLEWRILVGVLLILCNLLIIWLKLILFKMLGLSCVMLVIDLIIELIVLCCVFFWVCVNIDIYWILILVLDRVLGNGGIILCFLRMLNKWISIGLRMLCWNWVMIGLSFSIFFCFFLSIFVVVMLFCFLFVNIWKISV